MKNELIIENGVTAMANVFFVASVLILFGALVNNAYADDCDDGCITLCNNSSKRVTIATANPDGGIGCALTGNGCRMNIEGWWNLEPGQCYQPNASLYWSTYYSIANISNDGVWSYPSWPEDKTVLNGSKGLSGYSGYSICVNKDNSFRREVRGKAISAFNETCPAGYVKSPVNLYTSGEIDYDLTLSIK